MDFSIILDSFDVYLEGLYTTVWLGGLGHIIGLCIAITLGIGRNSNKWLLVGPTWAFIYFFRGTPLLVQLYLIYYGMDQFYPVKDTMWENAWFCALVAFIMNTSAYTSEIIRGAINGLPKGEVEAAKAYGMSPFATYRRIVLPSALRRALPAYSNEVIFMLHGSAVAGIVTILDLTGAARLVNSRYYAPFESFLTAGLFYMSLTFIILFVFKHAEKRFLAYLRPLESK